MATVLKSIVAFTGLVPGVPTTLPHGLNQNGLAVIPDHIESDTGSVVVVSATATDITVRNDSVAAASANILCERWHTTPRALPPGQADLPAQPFVPSGSASGQGGIASNIVRDPDGTGTVRTINVRITGNDTTGDGSGGNPYRTLRRALQDVPRYIAGKDRVFIDCTGAAPVGSPETSTDPLFIPTFQCETNELTFDFTAGILDAFLGPLTISAQPTVLTTLNPGDIASITSKPTTGLQEVNTNLSFALDQFKGKFILGSGVAQYAPITGNTAGPNSVISTAFGNPLTAPLQIVEPSFNFDHNVTAFGPTGIYVPSPRAAVVFNGIGMSTSGFGGKGLEVSGKAGVVQCALCDINGGVDTSAARFNIFGGRFGGGGTFFLDDSEVSLPHTFWDGLVIDLRGDGHFLSLSAFYADGTAATAGGTFLDSSLGVTNLGQHEVQNGEILNWTTDGIRAFNGNWRIQDMDIHDNAAGIIVRNAGRAILQDVQGVLNTGIGLKIEDMSLVDRGTTAIEGTAGDFQVGANAASAGGGAGWGGFGGYENDLGAGSPQICVLRN